MSPNRTPNISGGPLGRVWFRNKVEWNVLVPFHWNGSYIWLGAIRWSGMVILQYFVGEMKYNAFRSTHLLCRSGENTSHHLMCIYII